MTELMVFRFVYGFILIAGFGLGYYLGKRANKNEK